MTVMNMSHRGNGGGAVSADAIDDEAVIQRAQCIGNNSSRLQITTSTERSSVIAKTENQSQDGTVDIDQVSPLRRISHYFVRLSQRWPRLFAIIFKVILPLLSLILLSMMFGYWLAQVEAPGEISKNNLAIAARELLFLAAQLERVVMREGPLFCVNAYFQEDVGRITHENIDDYMLNELDKVSFALYQKSYGGPTTNIQEITQNGNLQEQFDYSDATTKKIFHLLDQYNVSKIDDIPRFLTFITDCGRRIDEMMNDMSVTAVMNGTDAYDISDTSVTFNWIKCPASDGNETTRANEKNLWTMFLETYKLEEAGVQEKVVVNRWKYHHHQLYTEYYAMYQKNPNMTRLEARDQAQMDSSLNANGFEGCICDKTSAAWFWFVVMTTIGYGNLSPSTNAGRTMVFTFGFLCILLFGTVLAKAGDIITTIFDDAVRRKPRLKWLSKPWVAMIFWGALFNLWLGVIAAATISWKKSRVAEELAWNDAFWFSFISITTVGLGDFYLDTEAIAPYDVVGFAMLFLIGFVLLANFLIMLGELPKSIFQGNSRNELEGQPMMPEDPNE